MRKKIYNALILTILLLLPGNAFPQSNITVFSSYWKHRADLFRILPDSKNEICFLGDSITDGCEWAELTGNPGCTNRGIGGDTAWGLMKRIDEVTSGKPSKVFLMIGTNDLAREKTVAEVRDKIAEIIDTIKKQSPGTVLYLQSVLPVIDSMTGNYQNKNINPLNIELKKLAEVRNVTWIDLASHFKDDSGQFKKEFTEDGLHLNGSAYKLWYSLIKRYMD
ncbi:MAG: sialate O-acetylesterase [Candidatus Latescibacteria bacterium]|nr:sialate O-acetylesterase [Candidatus Latescibacterota bacterium]